MASARSVVAAFLVALLAFEILPCALVEEPRTGGRGGGFACRIEPLQVCDHDETSVGVLSDLPGLLPGPTPLFVSAVRRRLPPEHAATLPEGHRPAIDRPPEASASS